MIGFSGMVRLGSCNSWTATCSCDFKWTSSHHVIREHLQAPRRRQEKHCGQHAVSRRRGRLAQSASQRRPSNSHRAACRNNAIQARAGISRREGGDDDLPKSLCPLGQLFAKWLRRPASTPPSKTVVATPKKRRKTASSFHGFSASMTFDLPDQPLAPIFWADAGRAELEGVFIRLFRLHITWRWAACEATFWAGHGVKLQGRIAVR
jgi:hypothetical protein